jgi:protein SCO1/2
LALLAVVLTACGGAEEPSVLAGIRRTPLPDVTGPTLPDVTRADAPFEFIADEGELLVLYFGYTHCPDVCPTTLADLRSALGKIDADHAERVALAFATVDPERDHADLITGYVQSFVPDAIALRTTDADELAAAAEPFGAVYDVTTTDAGDVEVIHSAFTYVIDDRGRLLVTWPFGIPADDMANDLTLLFDQQTQEV